MTYVIALERGDLNYRELEPLYRRHYGEMRGRLARDGTPIGEYAPRLDQYFTAFSGRWLLNFVVRLDGMAIGYSNVWLTNDMHNGELIAREDTIYIHPDHRNGIGKRLVRYILDDLKSRGVKRAIISPVTDLRVGKIWRRMGFRDTAALMTYSF